MSSCNKEAKCDCAQDTLRIARILQPDSIYGKDAIIQSLYPNTNFYKLPILAAFGWTGNYGEINYARSLFSFDLSFLNTNTTIKKAELSLFWDQYENLKEQFGENAFSIYRVISAWSETTVTWNNQPDITVSNKVSVPKSKLEDQSYLSIDVTNLVQDMIKFPGHSFGFMIELNQEIPFSLVIFGSSNNKDESKRPKLVVYF